jgi:coniferyl-aldehyde dehydrogenase
MNAIVTIEADRRPEQTLVRQRAAFLWDGAPALNERRADLKKLRNAVLDRRGEIEDALNADFGHRSRHETAIMEIMALVQGIDYLRRNEPCAASCGRRTVMSP